MEIKEMQFESKIHKLSDDFFNQKFNIPIYQRLYVWGQEEVGTLLEDLIKAYHHNSNHDYYLGGIVVVKTNNCYDLIDGQQRFTTLKILMECLENRSLSLEFSIREDVWQDFHSTEESSNVDIQRMKEAERLLTNNLKKQYDGRNIDKKEFLKYLTTHVNLVVTKVPEDTDLNKLFELINGRGEQLQQHEILKAKILSKIENTMDRKKYAKIWDICSNMNEHVDISIKKTLLKESKDKKLVNISWKEYFDAKYEDKDFSSLLEVLNTNEVNRNSISISQIIKVENYEISKEPEIDIEDEASTQYFSIISFPLFLLYSLVSFEEVEYFKKIKVESFEFKDKNLIKIFDIVLLSGLENKQSKIFIEHLFKFRQKFDKWVIKNKKDVGDNSNDTKHRITKVEKVTNSNNTITRKINNLQNSKGLSLLQSMLYHAHTRNTQEWIIPFLKNITNESSVEDALELLKNIDNVLYSQIFTEGTVLQRANDFEKTTIDFCEEIIKYLEKTPENYHYFSHYWFYKMDWIIWNSFKEKEEIKGFKFTARNSIEHISPQTKNIENKTENTLSPEYEHSFGNLALISVSQNSSFSNKGFKEKMGEFQEKIIPNLKMSLIFSNNNWNDEKCKNHLDECVSQVRKYFSCNKNDIQ